MNFSCHDDSLCAVLDHGTGTTGLFIVSGGNETLSGSHGNMAALASQIAAQGHPVFRYDRRGVGDSSGDNQGYEMGGDDMAAALATFREKMPDMERVIAFGNCDAATALALFHGTLRVDALILSNPWLIETTGDIPPPAAIKARYREKLRDPKEWLRLIRGNINIIKLFKGLLSLFQKNVTTGLPHKIHTALSTSPTPCHIILATRDTTAQVFYEHWNSTAYADLRASARFTMARIDTASHSYASKRDAEALLVKILDILS